MNSPNPPRTLRLGTRRSPLATAQSSLVRIALERLHPGLTVELVPIVTSGDTSNDPQFESIGAVGVFVREIEQALLKGTIDLAVHSLKDLPTQETPGLELAAVPKRGNPFDVLVTRERGTIGTLPPGARIGTASPRRAIQLTVLRPDATIEPIRGNIDTRLAKLHRGDYDAIVLAAAGLERLATAATLEAAGRLAPFDESSLVPAVGQGCLAVQIRADDDATRALVTPLDDGATHVAARAERAFLRSLGGGCRAPIAGFARPADAKTLHFHGLVGIPAEGENSPGPVLFRVTMSGALDSPEALGGAAARRLFSAGAGEMLGLAALLDP